MKLIIKEYWENLKTEYETAYKVSIFSDYNVLMQYAERFGSYLRGLMQEHPLDVDVVCALATVEQCCGMRKTQFNYWKISSKRIVVN